MPPTPGAGGPAPTGPIDVGVIKAWADHLGIPIDATVRQLTMLMRMDEIGIWRGSDELGGVAGALDSQQGELNQNTTDVLASGMTGQTADAIGRSGTEMVNQVAAVAEAARRVGGKFAEVATAVGANKAALADLTDATTVALMMLRP